MMVPTTRPPLAARIPVGSKCVVAFLLATAWLWGPLSKPGSAQEPRIQHLMFQDPLFVFPPDKYVYPPQLLPLWLKALQRPEAELQRLTADTLSIAVQHGMTELQPAIPALQRIVNASNSDHHAKRAAARALVLLDARQSAPVLAAQLGGVDLDYAQVVEPALATWDYQPMRDAWIARLNDPSTPSARLRLAVDALGTTRAGESQASLLKLLQDSKRDAAMRLAVARALALVDPSAAQRQAQAFIDGGTLERLLAVQLLQTQQDALATESLKKLATDDLSAIASAALNRLFDIDPALVLPVAAESLSNSDVMVRRVGVKTLIWQAEPASVELLAPRLADPNPSLRRQVAGALIDLGQVPLTQEVVISATRLVLAQSDWRGNEQAAIVLATLDDKPSVDVLVGLLDHERMEVGIAAAWALRRLQVDATLPAILDKAEQLYQEMRNTDITKADDLDQQLAHLLQAFGAMRYQPAEALLMEFVPKDFALGPYSRGAACWSLGHLYQDQHPEALSQQLTERLADMQSMFPELDLVRQMSAISLGRMRAESGLTELRLFARAEGSNTFLGQACGWSIERLTGEKRPAPYQNSVNIMNWYLRPRLNPAQ